MGTTTITTTKKQNKQENKYLQTTLAQNQITTTTNNIWEKQHQQKQQQTHKCFQTSLAQGAHGQTSLKIFVLFAFPMCCLLFGSEQTKQTTNNLRTKHTKTQTTGHPPAHHTNANRYLSGSGWMSCIFFLFLFL